MSLTLAALQGTWRVVAHEVDGARAADDAIRDARVVVSGDRFEALGLGTPYGGTLLLAGGGEPCEFELRIHHGPHAGLTSFGIHELTHDVWSLCLGLVGRPRPRRFATSSGSGHELKVLCRMTSAA